MAMALQGHYLSVNGWDLALLWLRLINRWMQRLSLDKWLCLYGSSRDWMSGLYRNLLGLDGLNLSLDGGHNLTRYLGFNHSLWCLGLELK